MATPYTDYGGGDYGSGGDYGAWQQAYAQQQEDERRRIEEELRRQQEEEARLAAEAQAAQAAQQQQQQPPPETFDRSQPPQTLGDLMQPPQQAHTYEMPAGPHTMPDGTVMAGGQPQTLGDLMQPPDQAQSYSGSVGAGGMSGIPADLANRKLAPGESLPAQPRDYSVQPLTGAELEAIGGNQHVPGASTYYGGSAFPTGTPSPDRKTSDMDLDQFNTEIRGSELYQQFIHDRGLWKPNGGVTEWREQDRKDWKALLEQSGVQVDGGMKIDNAGNINQKNTLGKKLAKVAIIAGAGAATIATGGAASPWLATAIGAGAGAGVGAIDGGVKGALIGAGVGGAGGYFMGGGKIPGIGGGSGGAATNVATNVGKDVGKEVVKEVAKDAVTKAGGGMLAGAMPQIVTGLAGLGTAYMGQRAKTQANERAAEASERGAASSERTLMANMEFEREQRDRDRADAERRWTAEQEMARRMWDASEEERLFKRNIFLEDRAAKAAGSGGGGVSYSGPSGPSEAELRKQQAIRNLDALLRQGTPGMPNSYIPATQAGPTGGRG